MAFCAGQVSREPITDQFAVNDLGTNPKTLPELGGFEC
jgi:hypothetical protein